MSSENESNDIKSRIIQSLFSYSTESGELLENYITHIRVLEESHYSSPSRFGSQHATRKQRYILISVKNDGNVQIHKSRENNNGTFSIGKTWDMNELQRIDNVDACKVIVTLQKPYHWICESAKDKALFIEVLVKIYKKFTGGEVPVMNGFDEMKNSDIMNYVPENISVLKRHSSISSNTQKNNQYQRPSSARYVSSQFSLGSDSFRFHKPNKSYTEEQLLRRQSSLSRSSKSNSFEKNRNSDLSKYEYELFPNKNSDNLAFENDAIEAHDNLITLSNKESSEKNTFSTNLSNSLKKYSDYEGIKIFNNEKDTEDFINYIDGVLDDFDWTELGNTERLEEKLKDELSTLQTANICAIIETNGRAVGLGERLMLSVKECENLSSLLALYSFGFNTIKDDIFHIETQNRGLQVQTANQKKLALELQNLLDTLSIDAHDLEALKKTPLDSTTGIVDIEKSLTFLYKALKISITSETDNETPTGDVIIMEGKRAEYEKESNEFLSRLAHYLNIRFQLELADIIHTDYSPTPKILKPQLVSHISAYVSFYHLSKFLCFYARQLNPSIFATFQEYYIKYTSGFYNSDFEKFFNVWRVITKKDMLEDADFLFVSVKEIIYNMINTKSADVKHSGTTVKTSRGPITDVWKYEKNQETGIPVNEAFSHVIKEIVNVVSQEHNFITLFFHMSSIRRQNYDELVSCNNTRVDIVEELKVKNPVESNRSSARSVLNMMSKIMNSLEENTLSFGEFCCRNDPMSIIDNVEFLKKHLLEWNETDQEYLMRVLNKLYSKYIEYFNIFIDTQIQAIEGVKLINKRKQGVLPFFKIFPSFVEKFNKQIVNFSDNTGTKELLYKAFEKIENAMFKTFKQLVRDACNLNSGSKTDVEDKDLLNYYIIIIENMFQYIEEIKKKNISILKLFQEKAVREYKEHLKLYIENIIKRPLGRIVEFSENMDTLLKTKAIEEIKSLIEFSPASVKRIAASHDIKEVLKGIEILYKRIEKHFKNEENYYHGQIAAIVWNKINDEYKFNIESFHQLVANYYKVDGIHIDWSYDDIKFSFFRKGM
ncbi:unnamed protein product [Pneumocystis jirovecii]|uniref:Exocyst complex component Sec3 PIP2-binding N-terminal domain-containing protein n=1 Tax=Pneumocystis jirovecii TaxID=42068 RepID=L0PBI8_PNEJI|nr:unnamed protein product [Pneumocystis jirovecii]